MDIKPIIRKTAINQEPTDEDKAKFYLKELRCKDCSSLIDIHLIKSGLFHYNDKEKSPSCCDVFSPLFKDYVGQRLFENKIMSDFHRCSRENMKILLSLIIVYDYYKFQYYVHHELANSWYVDDQLDFVFKECGFPC